MAAFKKIVLPCVLLWGCAHGPTHATTVIATPADYTTKITTLNPGDILELQAGHYVGGLPVYGLNGTSSQPITIRGPATGARAVFEGSDTQNVIRVRNSSFLIIQNLEVDGMQREGFGLSNEGSSTCPHDITVENLYIHDLVNVTPPIDESFRQVVAIALNSCTAWNWTLRGNRIERVGLGMYLGHPSGDQPFFSGVIEYNVITETIGYNIEIKAQNVRPTIVGMPTSDSRIIIRHNVFSKTPSSSAVTNARPNLLVGHMPPSGPGVNDRFEIYGNFFYQNATEVLFQGTGNIYFYDNLLYNSQGTAMAILPHEGGSPRDVHVFNNTILALDSGLSISGGMAGFTQEAFGNAIFAATPLSASSVRDNITGSFAAAATYLNNTSSDIAQLDLFPKNASLNGSTINYGNVSMPGGSTLGALSDAMNDFNGTAQPGNVRGAYVYAGSSTNPGWKLALTNKPTVSSSPPPPPPPGSPTVSLSAAPATVALNGNSTLTWTSANATSCVASGAWSGTKAPQGSQQVGPITTASTYTLACSNSNGSSQQSATVNLVAAPAVTLTANPTSVASGARTTLAWTSSGATSCAASGAWAGNKATTGTEQSAALSVDSTFALTCDGSGGSTTRTAMVTIATATPTPSPMPTPPTAPAGAGASSGGGAWSTSGLALLALLSFARRSALA